MPKRRLVHSWVTRAATMAGAVPRGEAAGLESNILVYMDNRDKWTPSEFAASYAEVIEGLGEITMKGSCHCKAVTFEAKSRHPWASWRCYCSICRKTTGGGGFSINLSSDLPSEVRFMWLDGAAAVGVLSCCLADGNKQPSSARQWLLRCSMPCHLIQLRCGATLGHNWCAYVPPSLHCLT